jgi:hypothetical protein
LKIGYLVRIGKHSSDYGLVTWAHPTKGVVQVYWVDDGMTYESCARLEILSIVLEEPADLESSQEHHPVEKYFPH